MVMYFVEEMSKSTYLEYLQNSFSIQKLMTCSQVVIFVNIRQCGAHAGCTAF